MSHMIIVWCILLRQFEEQEKQIALLERTENSTITHSLDGMGQARYGRETAMKVWIQRSLTS